MTDEKPDQLILAYNIMGHALCDTEHWQDWAKSWMDDNIPESHANLGFRAGP